MIATTTRTEQNTLRFAIRPESAPLGLGQKIPGTLDIGEGGRLLGIELELSGNPRLGNPWRRIPSVPDAPQFDPATAVFYLPIAPVTGSQMRSTSVSVEIFPGEDGGLVAIEIPRRGAGYEIAYPSGNQ